MGTTPQQATSREPAALADLRHQVGEFEADVAWLKRKIGSNGSPKRKPLWEVLAGQFDGDPLFAEIVNEGRAWREAQRPRPR